MGIRFEMNPKVIPKGTVVIELYSKAGIHFPNETPERMDRALKRSALVVCAWSGDELVGFARVVSDLAWVAWLSQIAVRPDHQKKGIGKRMMAQIIEELGDEVSLLTHSADDATRFYETLGMKPYSNVYLLRRRK